MNNPIFGPDEVMRVAAPSDILSRVSRAAIPVKVVTSRCLHRTRFEPPDALVVETGRYWIWFAIITGVAAFGLLAAHLATNSSDLTIFCFCAWPLFWGIPTGIIAHVAFRYSGTRAVLNRARNLLIVRGPNVSPVGQTEVPADGVALARGLESLVLNPPGITLPLDQVIAVQLLAERNDSPQDSLLYRAQQLNLVLSGDPPERITLFNVGGRHHRVRHIGTEIAQFLGVPLLDHTQ